MRMAEKQAAGLKNFYAAGTEMLTVDKKDKARLMELAAKYRLSPERLTVARRFARRYSEAEFAELISLRKPDGNLLHVGYVLFLLALNWQTKGEKQVRSALQREAAENGWTAPELRAVITQRYSKKASPCGRNHRELPLGVLIENAHSVVCNLLARLQCSDRIDLRSVPRLKDLQSEIWALDGVIPGEKKAA